LASFISKSALRRMAFACSLSSAALNPAHFVQTPLLKRSAEIFYGACQGANRKAGSTS
jgi:hypothetical protein